MANKAHKTQSFRTLDLLGLVVLVGVVGSICGAIIAQMFEDDRPARAKMTAEVLARQIRAHQNQVAQPPATLQRGPASVQSASLPQLTSGEIGKDPWGRPFHYVVRKASQAKGQIIRIYVWSDGSNGKADTEADMFEANAIAHHSLRGDDVGYVEEYTEI